MKGDGVKWLKPGLLIFYLYVTYKRLYNLSAISFFECKLENVMLSTA